MKKFVLIFVLAVHAVRCISMYQYVNEQGEQCVCATTGDPDMYDNPSIDLQSSERNVDSCEYRKYLHLSSILLYKHLPNE